MSLVTNIKGYINGNEWGVFEQQPLTYEEIIAYTDATALLEELNTYPSEYYDIINEEGHMNNVCGTSESVSYICQTGGYDFLKIANKYWAYNDFSAPLQRKYLDNAPCAT